MVVIGSDQDADIGEQHAASAQEDDESGDRYVCEYRYVIIEADFYVSQSNGGDDAVEYSERTGGF